MNRRLILVCLGSLGAMLAGPAPADIVHLKDGSNLEGEIRKVPDGWIVVHDGQITQVTADKVSSIEVKPLVTADTAMSRLNSLRRSIENISDIKQIIERYQNFISQNRDTPAAKDAAEELKIWRERQSKGLIKMGDRWVTPDERQGLLTRSADLAVQIHDMIKASQIKQAAAALDQALAVDSQSPSLLYLRGVVQYRQDQFAPARKSFEQVLALLSDHPPTLNNLAVVNWRQNSRGAALGYYDRAMIAAPGNRDILDNVYEAVNAMTPEMKKSAIAQKVIRRFTEQDDDLQKRMKQKGQYRWGSSWVDEDQKAKFEEQEKAMKEELAKLQSEFDEVQAKVTTTDLRINEVQQMMRNIEAQSVGQTPDGRPIQLGLPPSYFQYGRELDSLKLTRVSLVANMDRLRGQAKQVQAKAPTPPRFTGIQKLIDADGVPLPKPPATQPAPATQPTGLSN
jgi:tetratricopeptide (TPR) repeat protein